MSDEGEGPDVGVVVDSDNVGGWLFLDMRVVWADVLGNGASSMMTRQKDLEDCAGGR